MNTISKIWVGELYPLEKLGVGDPEIAKAERRIERCREKLSEELNENQKKTLEKYFDCTNELIGLLNEEAFCTGFSLGARITAEALVGKDR